MSRTVVPIVRLVLVLAVGQVSAGADTYNCVRWGYFQQRCSVTAHPCLVPAGARHIPHEAGVVISGIACSVPDARALHHPHGVSPYLTKWYTPSPMQDLLMELMLPPPNTAWLHAPLPRHHLRSPLVSPRRTRLPGRTRSTTHPQTTPRLSRPNPWRSSTPWCTHTLETRHRCSR